jgi:hypothetical protein
MMRARIGGFPDHCQIFTLGPHGRFWLDGRYHVFVSTSMAGLQVGVEQISDELVHIWLYHPLIGELRIGAGIGRNVSVQPLAPPQPIVSRNARCRQVGVTEQPEADSSGTKRNSAGTTS